MMKSAAVLTCAAFSLLVLTACSGEENAERATPAPVGDAAATDDTEAPDVDAPEIPDTEIFLAELSFDDDAPRVGAFKNATRHEGYDNQPWFLPGEDAFFFSSSDETGETDIWLYDIARDGRQRVFSSPEVSEFSPRLAPGGARISYIQQDETGEITRVHTRARDSSDEGGAVIAFAPLGYYAWLKGGDALAVFYRSEPGSLYLADVESGETRELHKSIGRTLESDFDGAQLWFTEAPAFDEEGNPEGAYRIMRYGIDEDSIDPVFDLPGEAADFALAYGFEGEAIGFFAADGATLYYRDLDRGDWMEAADLAASGVAAPNRVAVSPDKRWIAVVGEAQ